MRTLFAKADQTSGPSLPNRYPTVLSRHHQEHSTTQALATD
jgi:hypothetical protein